VEELEEIMSPESEVIKTIFSDTLLNLLEDKKDPEELIINAYIFRKNLPKFIKSLSKFGLIKIRPAFAMTSKPKFDWWLETQLLFVFEFNKAIDKKSMYNKIERSLYKESERINKFNSDFEFGNLMDQPSNSRAMVVKCYLY
jgi:hypothetical protein